MRILTQCLGVLTILAIHLILGSASGQAETAGSGLPDARDKALIELGSSMKQQISLLAISDGFILIALRAAFCLLTLGFAPPLVPAPKKTT